MIRIGEKLGNFLIRAEIGRGGMGTIYFALDTMLNREVALKVVHPQLADNQQLMERFKIEAMTQARLNHPNIVTIFSFNKIEDQYVIAMEYIEGRSLKEVLQEKKQLHPADAVDIIAQVAEGLRYAHAHNVIHRDIKPANILVNREGKVKISDFGIAKILGSQSLTKTGMLIGTPWYTSPEQIVGKEIDCRTDLYSLGVTFYELLTGRVPFDSETNSEFQIQKAHLETPPPRPSIFNPEIGIKLEKFILLALQKKVDKRFQSARDMIDELHTIRHDLTRAGFTASPGVTQKIDLPSVKKRPLLLVLALLILLVTGIVLILLLTGKNTMVESRGGSTEWRPALSISGTQNPEKAGGASAGPLPAASGLDEKDPGRLTAKEGVAEDPGMNQGPSQVQLDSQVEKTEMEQPAAAAATAVSSPLRRDETGKALEPAQQPVSRDASPPGQGSGKESPETLETLDVELVRLRGFLETRNLIAADRLTNALIRSGAESRAWPMLGKVKFLMGQFTAAERLWSRALQQNLLVSLEVLHVHGSPDDFCLGQLKFKKKIIMFNSNTRGDHSFAIPADNLRPLILGSDMKIGIVGTVGGQEINETFLVAGQLRRPHKEKFLIDFINQYVL